MTMFTGRATSLGVKREPGFARYGATDYKPSSKIWSALRQTRSPKGHLLFAPPPPL
jgi:hypothetical protein